LWRIEGIHTTSSEDGDKEGRRGREREESDTDIVGTYNNMQKRDKERSMTKQMQRGWGGLFTPFVWRVVDSAKAK